MKPYYETLNAHPKDIQAVKILISAHRTISNPQRIEHPKAIAAAKGYCVAHLETCLTLDSHKPPMVQLPGGNF